MYTHLNIKSKLYSRSTTSLTKTYYAKYLLRFLRCQRLDIEIQEYKEKEKIGFAKGAFLVSKWQHVAENIIPQWEDVSCILEDTTTRIQNILQTRKNSKRPRRTLSEKEQTKEKVEITVHMLFQECNFHCDLLADSDKEDWNEILQAYYITEVRIQLTLPIIFINKITITSNICSTITTGIEKPKRKTDYNCHHSRRHTKSPRLKK